MLNAKNKTLPHVPFAVKGKNKITTQNMTYFQYDQHIDAY